MVDFDYYPLPYKKDIGTPQRLYFGIDQNGYQVLWHHNSYDDVMIIEIQDLTNGEVLCIAPVIPEGFFPAQDSQGFLKFGVYVKDPNPEEPEVWIFTREQVEFLRDNL